MAKMTIGVAAFWLASLFASAVLAQDYPTRPVTMVVHAAFGVVPTAHFGIGG